MSARRFRWRASVALAVVAGMGASALLVSAQAATPGATAMQSTVRRPAQFTDLAGVLAGAPVHGAILDGLQMRPTAMIGDLERMKIDGINTLSIYIMTYVDDPHNASTVSKGAKTPSDGELRLLTKAAHSLGMAVEFHPLLWNEGSYVWRGSYRYSKVSTFFASYRATIDHYADLANSLGVELYSIGSENRSLVRYTALWRSLASDVRGRYHGLITAMVLPADAPIVKWWPSVDVISLSPYYSLSDRDNPGVGELVYAWNQVLPDVAALAARYHKQVLFDEIGYVSQLKAAWHPWDEHRGIAPTPSQQAQARAYEALFQATANKPWLRGIVWFYWQVPTNLPNVDTTMSLVGKTAECVVAQHWAPNPAAFKALANVGTLCTLSRL